MKFKQIVCILYVFFIMFLIKTSVQARIVDRVLAVVNDEIITQSELNDRKQKMIAEMNRMVNPEDLKEKINEVASQTLTMMIEEILMLQKADETGIKVDKNSIKDALDNVMKINHIDNIEQLKQALKKEGLSLDDYKKVIEKQLKIFRVQNHFVKPKVRIIDEEIQNYYQNNKKDYNTPLKFSLRNILISKKADEKDAETLKRAENVYKLLKKGDDFCKIAKKFSDDPTGSTCGDLGEIFEKDLLPEFKKAIKNLKKNEISSPFKTRFGYQIIQVMDISGGTTKLSNKIKDKIRQKLFQKKFFEKREEWLNELKKANYIKIISDSAKASYHQKNK